MIAATAVVFVVACDANDAGLEDFVGHYQGTSLMINNFSCADMDPRTLTFSYLRLTLSELLGEEVLELQRCGGIYPDTCSEGLSRENGYSQTDSGEILAIDPSGYWDWEVDMCTLWYWRSELILKDDHLRVETRSYSETITEESQCTEREAKLRGRSMPCVAHGWIESVKEN